MSTRPEFQRTDDGLAPGQRATVANLRAALGNDVPGERAGLAALARGVPESLACG